MSKFGVRWYAVHTFTGHEKKVSRDILQRAESMNLGAKIFETAIPEHQVTKYKEGKKSVVTEKIIPGYVLIKMILDDATWECVRRTPSVTRFAGGNEETPTPVSDDEVERLLQKDKKEGVKNTEVISPDINVGDAVQVKDGPFGGMSGTVLERSDVTDKCKILCNIFGRDTRVSVYLSSLEKVN